MTTNTTHTMTHLTKTGRPCRIVRSGSVVSTIAYADQPGIWSYPTAALRIAGK